MDSLKRLNCEVVECRKCPRLSRYIRRIARKKVKRYKTERYWGKPLPGFGVINAELLIVGLAPAAHGGNRTGRMFTGDSSGVWVAKVLYDNGFATSSTSRHKKNGFRLCNTYITAVVRCAPPKNKPLRREIENCSPYLERELKILRRVRVILCLGKLAFDSCCRILKIKGKKFFHGNLFRYGKWIIICSYHPSRQNTQTGRLKWDQWNKVFLIAKKVLVSKD